MIACFAIFSCISASLSLSASAEISLSFSFCSLNSWIYRWIINHIKKHLDAIHTYPFLFENGDFSLQFGLNCPPSNQCFYHLWFKKRKQREWSHTCLCWWSLRFCSLSSAALNACSSCSCCFAAIMVCSFRASSFCSLNASTSEQKKIKLF